MTSFAVIFDINGTLVDTETAHYSGYRDVLKEVGIEITLSQFTDVWSRQGKKLDDFLKLIKRDDLLPEVDSMKRRKDDIFQSTIAERITLMPGAREILTLLQSAGIPLGLDTSGSRENMEMILSLFGLTNFFTHTANGDTVIDEKKYGSRKWKASRLKYLADTFGLPTTSCIMVGDAEKDLKGAKDARMHCIIVPNAYSEGQDFLMADRVATSLLDLTVETFVGLMR